MAGGTMRPAPKVQRLKMYTGPFGGRFAMVERITGQGSTGLVVWRLEGDEGRERQMRLKVFRNWVNPVKAKWRTW